MQYLIEKCIDTTLVRALCVLWLFVRLLVLYFAASLWIYSIAFFICRISITALTFSCSNCTVSGKDSSNMGFTFNSVVFNPRNISTEHNQISRPPSFLVPSPSMGAWLSVAGFTSIIDSHLVDGSFHSNHKALTARSTFSHSLSTVPFAQGQ